MFNYIPSNILLLTLRKHFTNWYKSSYKNMSQIYVASVMGHGSQGISISWISKIMKCADEGKYDCFMPYLAQVKHA